MVCNGENWTLKLSVTKIICSGPGTWSSDKFPHYQCDLLKKWQMKSLFFQLNFRSHNNADLFLDYLTLPAVCVIPSCSRNLPVLFVALLLYETVESGLRGQTLCLGWIMQIKRLLLPAREASLSICTGFYIPQHILWNRTVSQVAFGHE